jgi:hypothetical protein
VAAHLDSGTMTTSEKQLLAQSASDPSPGRVNELKFLITGKIPLDGHTRSIHSTSTSSPIATRISPSRGGSGSNAKGRDQLSVIPPLMFFTLDETEVGNCAHLGGRWKAVRPDGTDA